MEQIINSAKKLANECFEHFEQKQKEFLMLHSDNVSKTAIALAKENINQKDITVAGWLHDIGRVVDIKTHPLKSIELAEAHGFILNDTIKDCILNHGRNAKPKTIEGKYFQIADKACIFDITTLELCKKYDNYDFLEKMSKSAFDLLKR